MGDSWDETSFDISDNGARKPSKNNFDDDFNNDIFGSSNQKSKPSLLDAMKKSTGRGIFDDDDKNAMSKNQTAFKAPQTQVNKPMQYKTQESMRPGLKTPTPKKKIDDDDDDLLADILGDYDENEPVQKVPTKSTTAKSTKAPTLFDDDDELLGILGSDQESGHPKPNSSFTSKKSAPADKLSKFDAMLNRTSIMKESENKTFVKPEQTTSSRGISTPIKKGPKTDDDNINMGFTPSFFSAGSARSRRGASGVRTPQQRLDDSFNQLMQDDFEEAKPKPAQLDIFRVDNKQQLKSASVNVEARHKDGFLSAPHAGLMSQSLGPNLDDSVPRASTPVRNNRPHTHSGLPLGEDFFTSSRPPSVGRRAATAQQSGANTPSRRRSNDSLFVDEDNIRDKNWTQKQLPWEDGHSKPETPVKKAVLPWEQQSQVESEVLSVPASYKPTDNLEKVVDNLKDSKFKVDKEIEEKNKELLEMRERNKKEVGELNTKVQNLEDKVRSLEENLSEKDKENKEHKRRVDEADGELTALKTRLEERHAREIADMERTYKDRIASLNGLIDEKERLLQTEVRVANARLKERETQLIDERERLRGELESRIRDKDSLHQDTIETLKRNAATELEDVIRENNRDLEREKEQKKEEICSILLQKMSFNDNDVPNVSGLSAQEVEAIKRKLDTSTNESVSEREKAIKTMCFYLSELQQKLDSQELAINEERHRLQEVVAAMEVHLRNQTQMSAVTQNKLMNDEARLHAEKIKFDADKVEFERRMEVEREKIDGLKQQLLVEQERLLERIHSEKNEISKEKVRIANISQLATSQHAKDAVRQLDCEAQAQALLDKAKRDAAEIRMQKELWEKEREKKRHLFENLEKREREVLTEKKRVSKMTGQLMERREQIDEYSKALTVARNECMGVQKQLAVLEAELRMKEEELHLKEATFRDAEAALKAEKDLLRIDRDNLDAEGINCPACQKFRPRIANNFRSTSPVLLKDRISPTLRSPLNTSVLSNGLSPSRHKYPSSSVLELTESLQRTHTDQQTLQFQLQRINKLKEFDHRILSS